jgi:hypothetical protein
MVALWIVLLAAGALGAAAVKGAQVVRANSVAYSPQQGAPGYAGYVPSTGGTAFTQYAYM